MKENIYDNDAFFEAYQKFPRSVEGLSAAGEWHELKKLLPDFQGKRVLDIGCGFGWHCVYAASKGATYVLGTDISEKMLAVAKEKAASDVVTYKQAAMEDLQLDDESFDVVMSSLAFHYTPNFDQVVQVIHSALKPGGVFVFSVEHPVFTAQGKQDWIYDSEDKPAYWPVDNYFFEGKREAIFLGEQVVKYHRTVTTYLQTLLKYGFCIKAVVEPEPAKELLEQVEGMKDELRRPMMLLVSCIKK